RHVGGHAAALRLDTVEGPARAAEPRTDCRAGKEAAQPAGRRAHPAPLPRPRGGRSAGVTPADKAPLSRRLSPPEHYDLAGTRAPLAMNRHDPCAKIGGREAWWATRTPDGPGTLSLARDGAELVATAWGPGAGWLVDRADAVAGLRDDVSGFAEIAA